MKTLIAYVTKTGTCEKAAQMIADKLKDKPDIVDLGAVKNPDISGYDFILVGGPVNMGMVNKTVKKFLSKNKNALLTKRFGMFLACGYPEELNRYLDTALDAELKAHAEVKTDIGYAYYLKKLGPIAQKIILEFAKVNESVEAYKPEAILAIVEIINA